MSGLDKLAVYVEYQNAYRGARQAFGEGEDHHVVGQFDPLELAKVIERRHPSYLGARLRRLVQVKVYRGMPSSTHSPEGYAAARRQVSHWRSGAGTEAPPLEVLTRPLDYRTGQPREKGIDVLLALDLAFGAANGDFDVVVLFSGDSDLLPALERARASGVVCEVAAWAGGGRRQPRKDYITWEHRLQRLDYDQVHDPFNYRR
ncbi:MAG: NYN domain-containing protein [Acidimicrobiaceae bacterium]|nr:NYN domain-containing protein [Acidimicrobiaceae bacterium]